MREIDRIAATYGQIDAHLAALKRDPAATAAAVKSIEARQTVNDQAYFVLCWAQFEDRVDDMCRKAIRKRQQNVDWRHRRGWDLYNPDDKRLSGLSFEERLALVADKKSKTGPWASVITLYAVRNRIAHGRLQDTRIDVPSIVRDLRQYQSQLEE